MSSAGEVPQLETVEYRILLCRLAVSPTQPAGGPVPLPKVLTDPTRLRGESHDVIHRHRVVQTNPRD